MKLEGRYTNADIFVETIEEGVIGQVYDIINCKAFEGKKVVCMPDAHVGKASCCGLVAEIGDYVCPAHVGLDIGCSVSVMVLDKRVPEELYAEIEHKIKKTIPMWFNIHEKTVIDEKDFFKFLRSWISRHKAWQPEILAGLPDDVDEKWMSAMLKRINMDEEVFWKSIGTCGGGNHYLELDRGEEEDIINIHFGSRNFGLKVCEYWMKVAKNTMPSKDELKQLTAKFKAGYKGDMREFKKALNLYIEYVTEDRISGYLNGANMKGYLCDMVIAEAYARMNHLTVQSMIEKILSKYAIHPINETHTMHNYIDFRDFTLRKSAISANAGELVVIPFNMRDGVAICEGLGNDAWLNSAPHGAGRKMSRSKAKQTLNLKDFENTMKDVYSTTVCQGTIDEAPMAYKDTDEIVRQIDGTTVKILHLYKPVINIKAVEGPKPWEKK